MRSLAIAAVLASSALCQSGPVGTEPSPMEEFAALPSVQASWSGEVTRIQEGETVVQLTPLVLRDSANSAQTFHGVKIDMSGFGGHEQIYLDETAIKCTIAALDSISTALARPHPGGCMGRRSFGPTTTGNGTSITS